MKRETDGGPESESAHSLWGKQNWREWGLKVLTETHWPVCSQLSLHTVVGVGPSSSPFWLQPVFPALLMEAAALCLTVCVWLYAQTKVCLSMSTHVRVCVWGIILSAFSSVCVCVSAASQCICVAVWSDALPICTCCTDDREQQALFSTVHEGVGCEGWLMSETLMYVTCTSSCKKCIYLT